MLNFIIYWWRTRVSKWSVDELVDSIQARAWRWAKKNYDKEAKAFNVTRAMLEQASHYSGVSIYEPQAKAFRKEAMLNFTAGLIISVVEGNLVYGAIKFYLGEHRTLSELSDLELFSLFGLSLVVTGIFVLGFHYVIRELNFRSLRDDLIEFNIPEKYVKEPMISRSLICFIGFLVFALNIFLGINRGLNAKGYYDWFSIILPLAVSIISAYAFYRSYKASKLYSAWKEKHKFEQMLQRYNNAKLKRQELKEKLADQAATKYFSLVRMVRALLKYPEEKKTSPKTYSEFREIISEEFQKTLKAEAETQLPYERPDCNSRGRNMETTPPPSNGVGIKNKLLNFIFLIILASSLSGCDFIRKSLTGSTTKEEQKQETKSGRKKIFVRVLVDISGTTTPQRWMDYKDGIFQILLHLRGQGSMVVFPIDAASFSDPVRMMSIDFEKDDFGCGEKVRHAIEGLPEQHRPPFIAAGDFEKPEQIFAKRIRPFVNEVRPYFEAEMDSILTTRKGYTSRTDILGAILNLEEDFSNADNKEGGNSFFSNDVEVEKWLFLFSDMLHNSEGMNFERAFGVTREETMSLINNLTATEKMPVFNGTKVVIIGRGFVEGGPISKDGLMNVQFFWQQFFRNTKSEVVHVGSTDDKADIAKILKK